MDTPITPRRTLCSVCRTSLGSERSPTHAMLWLSITVRDASSGLMPETYPEVDAEICWRCVKKIRIALAEEREHHPSHADARDKL